MPGTGITEAPLAAADSKLHLAAQVMAFVDKAKADAKDGLTVAEFGELLFALLRLAMDGAAASSAAGVDKKAFVLSSAAVLFDSVADLCVPAYLIPAWWVLKPTIRALILALIGGTSAAGKPSGAVEVLLPRV